jgi:hypothetical protein
MSFYRQKKSSGRRVAALAEHFKVFIMDFSIVSDASQSIEVPPYTNRGVRSENSPETALETVENCLLSSFFDWYAASVEIEDLEHFVNIAKAYFVCSIEDCTPQPPYEKAIRFFNPDETIFKMNFGGHNERPFLVSSGATSGHFAQFLREHYSEHFVSRFDTALDFDEEGAFDYLLELFKMTKEEHNLKIRYVGDWSSEVVDGKIVYTGKGGRTVYLGSRTSPVFFRMYEKGKEQREKLIDSNASLDWCRLELEVKPHKRHNKLKASKLNPKDAYSCSRAAIFMSNYLGENDTPLVKMGTVWKKKDDLDATLAHMLHQYGNTIERVIEERLGGNYNQLGLFLLSEMDSAKLKVSRSRST